MNYKYKLQPTTLLENTTQYLIFCNSRIMFMTVYIHNYYCIVTVMATLIGFSVLLFVGLTVKPLPPTSCKQLS
jgi:hypothetical protein